MSLLRFHARAHPQQVTKGPGLFDLPPLPPGEDVDDRGTDPAWFAEIDKRFRFTVDVAAAEHNAKLPRYFDKTADGLAQSWAGERVWCNPPYSDIRPWVQKAWASFTDTPLIVMLLPANRTEQGWWQEQVEPARDRPDSSLRVEFLPGRLRFIAPGRSTIGPNERPPFGCCLLIWARA